jgi:hypothetical protein
MQWFLAPFAPEFPASAAQTQHVYRHRNPSTKCMDRDLKNKWLPLAILAAALVAWTILLALGAFLELGADQPRHDYRKPLYVLGSMAVFLSVWGLALWVRTRRGRQ